VKFLITGELKRKKHLYWGVLAFLGFAVVFWLNNFLYYYLNFGFSYESLFKYYFTDLEFPEKISLKQVSENVHINLFINGFLTLVILSILNVFDFKPSLKLWLSLSSFVFGFFYSVSDLLIYFLDGYIFIKPVSFLFFQFFLGVSLFLVLYGFIKKKTDVSIKILKISIGFFSFVMIAFFLLNFFLFYQKIGFCFECVKSYYLGSPEKYVKPKTLEGLFKIFYPHLITMSFLSFTLLHFLLFSSVNKVFSVILGVGGFVFTFLDNLSGIFIRFVNDFFIYLKLFSFFSLEVIFLVGFTLVLLSVLKNNPLEGGC
jgi:hypothetical protein